MKIFFILTSLLTPVFSLFVTAQNAFTVPWVNPEQEKAKNEFARYLQLQDASFSQDGLPMVTFLSPANTQYATFELTSIITEPVDPAWVLELNNTSAIPDDFTVTLHKSFTREKQGTRVEIIPIRRIPGTNLVERLISCEFLIAAEPVPASEKSGAGKGANTSVLASGNWFKIGTTQEGVHKITYEQLNSWGVLNGPVSSASIHLYGNGGGLLPEPNSAFRHDDLVENAIQIQDGGSGTFGPGAYLLFYGQSPDVWSYNSSKRMYTHSKHYMSDTAYYFITSAGSNGLRTPIRNSVNGAPNFTVSSYLETRFVEQDLYNLLHSGRLHMGRSFRFANNWDTSFTYQHLNTARPIKIQTQIAGRCVLCTTPFYLQANGVWFDTLTADICSADYHSEFAKFATSVDSFSVSASTFPFKVQLSNSFSTIDDNNAWLDWIEFNAWKNMTFQNNMIIRNPEMVGQGVSNITLQAAPGNVQIWDITDPLHPVQQQLNGSAFQIQTDSLMEFVAFEPANLPVPAYFGQIANQNIHAMTETQQVDLIIVAPKMLIPAAERLAQMHLEKDGMLVHVVASEEIYNEFSSGMQDVTAIRDMVKMYRDKSTTPGYPRYLCLMGDASFDYKTHLNRLPYANTNVLPTFQSINSFGRSGESYASDDFFSLLDDDEGVTGSIVTSITNGLDLEVGTGRIPAHSLEEALGVVDKIIHYVEDAACQRDWRNQVALVIDDMDAGWESLFFTNTETMANQLQNKYPVWNVQKIYTDAYQQVTDAGQRYPEANVAMNNTANKGALLINYIGHGGETGWTSERILQNTDVATWSNLNNLPVFATATCTFTRYDNPEFTSAGEEILLYPDKGGIALFSTSRAISIVPNFNREFLDATFSLLDNGEFPRLGDILDTTKNRSGDGGEQNILLFGDPAMRMAYPMFTVVTDSIGGKYADGVNMTDTLSASELITISGHIADHQGNVLNGFDGVLYMTIFDKKSSLQTLANDPASVSYNFTQFKNIVFKGKCTVTNGQWTITFQTPLDINYLMGQGKISYYAENGSVDAHGYYDKFIIGGSTNNCANDGQGPVLEIFMNDSNFVDGGITNSSPVLYVQVSDPSGINTTGIAIGHDLLVQIDNDPNQIYILNPFFESNLNDYSSGTVSYRLPQQTPGFHQLQVQVWDGCNNVTNGWLNYAVTNTEVALINFINFPNPFMFGTTFSFEHNQAESVMDVELGIYDIQGTQVKLIQRKDTPEGFRDTGIYWDGSSDSGAKLSGGVYIARVRITDNKGNQALGTTKLVYIPEY